MGNDLICQKIHIHYFTSINVTMIKMQESGILVRYQMFNINPMFHYSRIHKNIYVYILLFY